MEQIVVDDQDKHFLTKYTWYTVTSRNTKYARAHVPNSGRPGRKVYLHRIITAARPGEPVDHRDKNGLNNSRSNLRVCSRSSNMANSKKRAHSQQPYRGIRKSGDKWYAIITINKNRHYLGTFDTPEEAALTWDSAAKYFHGEFAVLNFEKKKK